MAGWCGLALALPLLLLLGDFRLALSAQLRAASVSPQAAEGAEPALLQTYDEALSGTATASHDTPITRVVKLLKEMSKTVQKEMDEDEAQYKKLACWCNNNNYEKDTAITETTAKISELRSSIEGLTSKKSELETNIQELEAELTSDQQTLQEATALREKQSSAFHGEETDDIQAIEQLKAAIEVLSKHTDTPLESTVAGGAVFKSEEDRWSFLSTNAKGFPWASDLKEASMVRSLDDFMRDNGFDDAAAAPAVAAAPSAKPQKFLQQEQASSGVQQEKAWSGNDLIVVKRAMKAASAFMQAHHEETYMPAYTARSGEIMGVLKQLKEEMEAGLSDSQKAEQARAATFAELRAAKQSEISNGEKMAETKEDQLADAANSLAEAKQDLAQEEATLAEDTRFLANLKETCGDANKNFEERKAARQTEMKAIAETVALLMEDDARDAISSTYSLLETGSRSDESAESAQRRTLAAEALRKVASRKGEPQLSVLASTVELDSFSQVIKAIDGMVAALKSDQLTEVQKNDWCKAEFHSNEMASMKTADFKADLETKLSALGLDIKTLEEGVADGHKQIAQTELELQRATENRKAESLDFQKTVEDQTLTIEVLKKALDKLARYYTFLQSSKSSSSSSTSGKQTPPVPQAEYVPNKSSTGVMEMIEKLIHEATALVSESKASQQSAQSAYEQLIANTNGSVQALSKDILVKEKAAGKAKKDKLLTEADLLAADKELDGLSKYQFDLKAECDYLLKNFEVRQSGRGEEIEALQQAKQILKGASVN